MAKITITIPYIAWRDGRPRFVPGPALRALGFAGEDLRHASGAWYRAEEAQSWMEEKLQAIAARRAEAGQAKARGKRLKSMPPVQGQALFTVRDLFEAWFKSDRLAGRTIEQGKRRRRPLAEATVRDYRTKARGLEQVAPDLYGASVEALTKPIIWGLWEKTYEARGLAMARGCIATLSSAMSWGMKSGLVRLASNPCQGLNMEMPQPRQRAASIAEIDQLVAVADHLGRPEIGDAILLGVWTGQRQQDRLSLLHTGRDAQGRITFQQAKTAARVAIPQSPDLLARLAAAKLRRKASLHDSLHVILDEKTGRIWSGDHYRKTFQRICKAAQAGIAGLFDPMPSLEGFRDQDLRDTAVTWLSRAGCTPQEVASITGHSLNSVVTILKHYFAPSQDIADQAMSKMVAWKDSQRGER